MPLPGYSTLQKLLTNMPFEPGIHPEMFLRLSRRVSKMKPLDRNCALLFDEIALSEQLVFNTSEDKVSGFVDLGPLGRKNEQANHALIFMVNGLHKTWKQPVAYFFTKDTIKTYDLKYLIHHIIVKLEETGLTILCCICDQAATNRAALNLLCENNIRSKPFFQVNNHKVFTIFDPPHLLKSTRNALLKYHIHYQHSKVAKIDHIRQCFHIDKRKRFQSLRRIREVYLHFVNRRRLKINVSVAARTLSHTVASTIEEMVSNPRHNVPSAAIHTAEFVHDVDQLFDSFNGRSIKPERGKPYRRCLSEKSPHLNLWRRLLPKINSWKFVSGKVNKSTMPFKSGWLITITATEELWKECHKLGFQFLRTRSLNQDPLENTFACIRHYGAQNSNPNCYQFTACFKTSLLNNLITPISNRNCENDDISILDNLQDFIKFDPSEITIPKLPSCEQNELSNINLPQIQVLADFTEHEANTLSYVAGFLIKKIKSIRECQKCSASFLTDDLESQHTFTMFKEYVDNKKVLSYTSKPVIVTLARIYDYVIFILEKFGHILDLSKKVKHLLLTHVTFDWLSCTDHLDLVKSDFLNLSIILVIRKFYDDIYRNSQIKTKKK